jgi:hypothetical protein
LWKKAEQKQAFAFASFWTFTENTEWILLRQRMK